METFAAHVCRAITRLDADSQLCTRRSRRNADYLSSLARKPNTVEPSLLDAHFRSSGSRRFSIILDSATGVPFVTQTESLLLFTQERPQELVVICADAQSVYGVLLSRKRRQYIGDLFTKSWKDEICPSCDYAVFGGWHAGVCRRSLKDVVGTPCQA